MGIIVTQRIHCAAADVGAEANISVQIAVSLPFFWRYLI